jgi:hypothetical protein
MMVKGEEFLKLRGRTRIPVAFKNIWQHFVSPLKRMKNKSYYDINNGNKNDVGNINSR